jgi:enoyl-CoA hydratase/carnithine racemase
VSEFVTGERRGATFVLTLRREPKLNAISGEMEREICDLLIAPELREAACVVFTGGERVFSAGADITEFADLDPAAITAYYRQTGDFVERVADLPQPTIAAISGYCLGGGFELALACDFRIADETAVFGLPEVELGIVPSFGGAYRLTRLLGAARAKELVVLRERVDAAEALRLGAVTEVVGSGEALHRALEHASRLAGLPRLAAGVAKRTIDAMAEAPRAAGLELERLAYGMLAQTSEADEGLKRFER